MHDFSFIVSMCPNYILHPQIINDGISKMYDDIINNKIKIQNKDA